MTNFFRISCTKNVNIGGLFLTQLFKKRLRESFMTVWYNWECSFALHFFQFIFKSRRPFSVSRFTTTPKRFICISKVDVTLNEQTKRMLYDASANQSLDCRWTIAASKPDVPPSSVYASFGRVSCRAAPQWRGIKCNLEPNRSDYATIHSTVAAASRCRRRVTMQTLSPVRSSYIVTYFFYLWINR